MRSPLNDASRRTVWIASRASLAPDLCGTPGMNSGLPPYTLACPFARGQLWVSPVLIGALHSGHVGLPAE